MQVMVFNLKINQNVDPENNEHQRLNFDVYTTSNCGRDTTNEIANIAEGCV